MNYLLNELNELNEGRSAKRPLMPCRPVLRARAWHTTLLLASGLTALTWSRLPAFAAPQDAAAQEAPATAQEAPAAQTVPCMLALDAQGLIVLFSGKAEELTENFTHQDGTAPTWTLTPDGTLLAQTADLMTKKEFDDFQLHVEFKIPPMAKADGKAGSSGIILHGRFAMQIRDSFGVSLPGIDDNGAIYHAHAPLLNASKAPNEWQSYDIIFRAPRFSEDGATRLQAASVTAFLNGVLVQNNTEITAPTEGYAIGSAKKPAPLLLQYHGCAVEFRNILILPLSRTPVASPPAALHTPVTLAWQDAQQGDQIKVEKVTFDAGGYQVVCGNGDTIVVPFADENTDVMKFGRSDTDCAYFVNDGTTPVLYLNNDLSNKGYLESAVVPNAKWYPLTTDYSYESPVYVDLAPSWLGYSSMGWYPGMAVYGGVLNSTRNTATTWMPGYSTSINGTSFSSYPAYIAYMSGHPTYVQNRVVYTNYATPVTGTGVLRDVKNGQVNGGTRSGQSGVPGPGLPRAGQSRQGLPGPGVLHPGQPRTGLPGPGLPRPGQPRRGVPGLPGPGLPRGGQPRPGLPRPGLPRAGQPHQGAPGPVVHNGRSPAPSRPTASAPNRKVSNGRRKR